MSRSILDLDIKAILTAIERKYRLKLPRNVIATDYGDKGDLYVRCKHADKPLGEPTRDGKVIFFRENGKQIVAVEILNVNGLS